MKQFLNEGTGVRFDSMCMILKQAKLINRYRSHDSV